MDDHRLNEFCAILERVAKKYPDDSLEGQTIALAASGLSHIYSHGQLDRFLAAAAESAREMTDEESHAANLALLQMVRMRLQAVQDSRRVLAALVTRFPQSSSETMAIELASEALGFVAKDVRIVEFDEYLRSRVVPINLSRDR